MANESEEKPSEPTRSSLGTIIIIIIVLGIAYLALRSAAQRQIDDVLAPSGPAAPRTTSAPETYTIRYELSGTASRADVTYENEGGNTEQKSNVIVKNWQLTMELERGDFFYISAQSQDDTSRIIRCDIYQDNELVESAESSGRYVIATCSGSAGD
jgi:hypothetical protein